MDSPDLLPEEWSMVVVAGFIMIAVSIYLVSKVLPRRNEKETRYEEMSPAWAFAWTASGLLMLAGISAVVAGFASGAPPVQTLVFTLIVAAVAAAIWQDEHTSKAR